MAYDIYSPEFKDYISCMQRVFENLDIGGIGNAQFHVFNKLMGWKETDWLIVDFEDPEKQRVIRQLAGPYGKTLLKVIELRKQVND